MVVLVAMWTPLLALFLCASASTNPACDDVMNDVGYGHGDHIQWSYDRATDGCVPFMFHGNGKSANIFPTDQACMKACSSKYNQLYPEGAEVCSLPKDKGPCLAVVVMWYYDSAQKECDTFFYSGCQGNGNRFVSKNNCTRTCSSSKKGKSGSSGAAEGEDAVQSSTDEGTIVAIVCSVIFAIAFIIILTLFIRQRKALKKQEKKHKFVAVEMN